MFWLFLSLFLSLESQAQPQAFCGDAYAAIARAIQRPPQNNSDISVQLQKFLMKIWGEANAEITSAFANKKFLFDSRWKGFVTKLERELLQRTKKVDDLRMQRRLVREKMKLAIGSRLEQLHEEKSIIDSSVNKLMDEVDAINSILTPVREWMGVLAVNSVGTELAKKSDSIIMLRNSPSTSVGQLMGYGVGKGINFKFHSSDMGVIAGLVPRDQSLSKAAAYGPKKMKEMQEMVEQALSLKLVDAHPFRIGTNMAVLRDGKVFFVDKSQELVDPTELVEVLAPKDALVGWIVSDIDPFAFAFRGPKSKARETNQMGVLTVKEQELIREFNKSLDRKIGKKDSQYMTHGPENRNPNSSGISGYPLTAYLPDGEVRVIQEGPSGDPDKNVKEFFQEAKEKGFNFEENPLWGWPES